MEWNGMERLTYDRTCVCVCVGRRGKARQGKANGFRYLFHLILASHLIHTSA